MRLKRWSLTVVIVAVAIINTVILFRFLGDSWVTYLSAGVLLIIISLCFTKLAPICDSEDRIVGYDDFYIPSMWSINGMIGTRLIKGKSRSDIRYSFFYLLGIPIFPLSCYCYKWELSEDGSSPVCIWGIAKWNIMDLILIYCRWVGIIFIGMGLLEVFHLVR